MIRDKLAYAKFHLNQLVKLCSNVYNTSTSSTDKLYAYRLCLFAKELLNDDVLDKYSDLELEMIGINAFKMWKPLLHIA